MLQALINGKIFTGSETITDKVLIVRDDQIAGIIDKKEIPSKAIIIDCTGNYIAPGLIDLQIYGGGGYLFSNNPTAEALIAMTNALIASGTTSFLVTLATNSIEIFREAIRVVKANPHPAIMGIHFEGPYLNPVKAGAHIKKYIKEPTRDEVELLLKEAEGIIKMITLAPEICNPDIIKLLIDNGVVISAGHSNATFAEASEGYNKGITTITHLYNAMSPLHHRDTGLPGAAYQINGLYASIIADGIHVDYNTLAISKKVMQEQLFLITDAVEEVKEGPYVHVRQADRFTLPDGTLSGSQLTLMQAVRNCVDYAEISLPEALRMASTYPARVINAGDLGVIKTGYKANMIIFNKELTIKGVLLNGVLTSGNI